MLDSLTVSQESETNGYDASVSDDSTEGEDGESVVDEHCGNLSLMTTILLQLQNLLFILKWDGRDGDATRYPGDRVHIVAGLSKDWGISGFRVGTLFTHNTELVTALET